MVDLYQMKVLLSWHELGNLLLDYESLPHYGHQSDDDGGGHQGHGHHQLDGDDVGDHGDGGHDGEHGHVDHAGEHGHGGDRVPH